MEQKRCWGFFLYSLQRGNLPIQFMCASSLVDLGGEEKKTNHNQTLSCSNLFTWIVLNLFATFLLPAPRCQLCVACINLYIHSRICVVSSLFGGALSLIYAFKLPRLVYWLRHQFATNEIYVDAHEWIYRFRLQITLYTIFSLTQILLKPFRMGFDNPRNLPNYLNREYNSVYFHSLMRLYQNE